MNIKDIPFIIPNFNQLTYLRGLINQIRFYYPENPIVVIDNGSDYGPLLEYYAMQRELSNSGRQDFEPAIYPNNDFVDNLYRYINSHQYEYYVITDPDLSIHPATPPNFLEIFKTAIDVYGFHHAGFGLITDDIPSWNLKAAWIQGDEKALLTNKSIIHYNEDGYTCSAEGYRAPIDTTFALYKRDNGGWQSPMSGEAWSNCIRLFGVHHLPWYLKKDNLNPEMQNYFATCKRFEPGQVSSGKNNYRPE